MGVASTLPQHYTKHYTKHYTNDTPNYSFNHVAENIVTA